MSQCGGMAYTYVLETYDESLAGSSPVTGTNFMCVQLNQEWDDHPESDKSIEYAILLTLIDSGSNPERTPI